jgi:hypothetical protein
MEGCGVLGTVRCKPCADFLLYSFFSSSQGGGGSPYSTYLACRQLLRDGGSMHIVDHRSLNDDDVVARGGKIIKILH